MKFSKIEINNFKSFDDVVINLNDLNVVVGECASGKSNFIEVFRFLKDLCEDFDGGIRKHGGPFLQNYNLKTSKPTRIKIEMDCEKQLMSVTDENNKVFYNSIAYNLCINFKHNNPVIIEEMVKFDYNVESNDSEILSQNSFFLKNDGNEIIAGFENEEKYVDLEFFAPKSLLNIVNNNLQIKKELIINSPLTSIPVKWLNLFKSINFYNFDPKFCKLETNNGNNILTEYGENLSAVLDDILKQDNYKKEFLNLISILIPYIEGINVELIGDNRRIFKIKECYSQEYVFSPFVSDGTVNILALISALYFEKGNIILIEEVEKHIHPSLLMKIVGMIKEVSNNKQIVITTHSPEILDYCDLKDICLVYRDLNGNSNISKPDDDEDVRKFSEELGIGNVFLNNYLMLK